MVHERLEGLSINMIKNVKMAILWDSVHFGLGNIPKIWRNLLPPSLGQKRDFQRKPLPCLHNEDGGSRFPKRRHVYRTTRRHIPRNHHLLFTEQTSSFIKYSQIWHPSEKLLNFKGVEHRLKTNHGNGRQMTDEQTFVWILQTLSQNAQGKAETSTFLRMLQPTTAHSSVLVEQVNVASLSIPINLSLLPSADMTENQKDIIKSIHIIIIIIIEFSALQCLEYLPTICCHGEGPAPLNTCVINKSFYLIIPLLCNSV